MSIEISKIYSAKEIEDKWYSYWIEQNYFHSEPDSREPFSIVIPPPNVTGVLHMGHMLNNTIQDVLIRRARMKGKNTCWVPGTDHASIATEAKVVQMLREKGIKKSDLSREDFLKYAWEWKEKYGGIILEQLKKLGASCDWQRTRFTMEPKLSGAVTDVFIDLFEKGMIYRGLRMVNWDPQGKTALSDEEVIYKEVNSKLYFIRYKFSGDENSSFITIATTRPETILADTAVCVNPNDERYNQFIGRTVLVPFINRPIPIIADEYVAMDFGTGCLKVTPAHDINDYALGQKFNLPIIDILNDDGTLNEKCEVEKYNNKDRFAVRKQIAIDLEDGGFIQKIEEYKNQVGTSERTGAVIEPRLSLQWWVDMKKFMAKNPQVLDSVMNDEIKFHPAKMKNTYKHWLENIKDWCISRQLWWGQRIPAWYDSKGNFVVAKTIDEAISKFKVQGLKVEESEIKQDEDVLDTWFSSWIWPISVFDGFDDKSNKDINYYYPTNDLVTGPDIIFFWVARMVMSGYEFKQQKPFNNVYFTGLIRDKQRRKMSKSLGNSPDPLELIEKFGADGVRMGMLLCSPAGNDILFDESLLEQGRNFSNKIWNAFRLIKGWEIKPDSQFDLELLKSNQISAQWFDNRLDEILNDIENKFSDYKLSEALMAIYKLIWDDFCSWYLEMIKPNFGDPINQSTYTKTIELFEKLMKILHPFMPFVTEEIWQNLDSRKKGESICIASYPNINTSKVNSENNLERAFETISKIRELRNKNGISPKTSFEISVKTNEEKLYKPYEFLIKKLANISSIVYAEGASKSNVLAVATDQVFVELNIQLDVDAEKGKAIQEIKYLEGFLQSVDQKLSNAKFVENAKPELIEKEKQKKLDAEIKMALLKSKLNKL